MDENSREWMRMDCDPEEKIRRKNLFHWRSRTIYAGLAVESIRSNPFARLTGLVAVACTLTLTFKHSLGSMDSPLPGRVGRNPVDTTL